MKTYTQANENKDYLAGATEQVGKTLSQELITTTGASNMGSNTTRKRVATIEQTVTDMFNGQSRLMGDIQGFRQSEEEKLRQSKRASRLR
jgi:N-acetylglucosamine-6-phosphate deacetylase